MHFSVLGPLAVHGAPGHQVPSAMMPQRLLALLLLNANHVVSTSTVVDELWTAVPSKRARQTVQTYVYQLRRALGPEAGGSVETHPRGYLMRLAEDQLDLWRFEDLAARGQAALRGGDPARAAELLAQALDLWSGTPLEGLNAGPVLEARRVLLNDRRLVVLEQRIDADLAGGAHRALLPELTALVAEHPSHEEFTAQLMTAAHRAGRRGEALTAYQRLRRHLVDELGLEPSGRLQVLYRELLRDAPGAEAAGTTEAAGRRVVPAQLPFDIGDFVGRGEEMASVVPTLRADEPRRVVPLVAVIGQAGIGKTAFAVRVGHSVRSAFPDGQLMASLHSADEPVDPGNVLRSFLLALGVPPARQPADTDDRAQLFRSLVADRRLLVLLDDAASVEQVVPLLPAGPGCAALLTSRVRLRGLPVTSTVELGPLPVEDGVALLSAVLGPARVAARPDDARRIVTMCDRSPFAVRTAAEKLLSRPVWPLAKFAARLAVESRRLAELHTGTLDIRARLDSARGRLGSFESRSLEALCETFGANRFDIATAATVLDVPELSVEPLMEALVDAHLLHIVGVKPSGTAWFRFPDLVRLHAVDGRRVLSRVSAPTSPAPP